MKNNYTIIDNDLYKDYDYLYDVLGKTEEVPLTWAVKDGDELARREGREGRLQAEEIA